MEPNPQSLVIEIKLCQLPSCNMVPAKTRFLFLYNCVFFVKGNSLSLMENYLLNCNFPCKDKNLFTITKSTVNACHLLNTFLLNKSNPCSCQIWTNLLCWLMYSESWYPGVYQNTCMMAHLIVCKHYFVNGLLSYSFWHWSIKYDFCWTFGIHFGQFNRNWWQFIPYMAIFRSNYHFIVHITRHCLLFLVSVSF